MRKKEVESILLMNQFLTIHQKNKNCSYFLRKIIDSKIKTTLQDKPSYSAPLWMLGFIFAGRLGLWS